MDEKINLLLVEDDLNLGHLLQDYLEAKGYNADLAVNGKEGLEFFKDKNYDIILLDVMMPIMDGYTLAKEIRKNNTTVPIVFLTAKSMKQDAIDGFNAGADDYITKPFNMEELLLRIKAILRRTKKQSPLANENNVFTLGKYQFDFNHQILQIDKQQQRLTTREAQLLKLLCVHANDVLDRNYALRIIWEDDNYFNGRSMDVYIAKLRKYLKEDKNIEIINVHGKGFKLLVNYNL